MHHSLLQVVPVGNAQHSSQQKFFFFVSFTFQCIEERVTCNSPYLLAFLDQQLFAQNKIYT